MKVTWPTNQYLSGVGFGFVSVAVLFIPLYFVRKHKNKFATILAFMLTFLIFFDHVYFSYFGALPTVGLISSLGQTSDVGPAIIGLLSVWMLLYFIDIALVIIFNKQIAKLFAKIKTKLAQDTSNGTPVSILATSITLIILWFTILPLGLSNLTDVLNRGYDTVSTSQYYGVLIAHGVDIVRFVKEETTVLSSSEVKALQTWVSTNHPKQATSNLTGTAKGKNVIMIQVESLAGYVVNQKINDHEITPNLNKLANESQFFPNDRYVLGAGHTSDTDFVANTSYFPLADAAVFVRYGNDNFTSLAKTLKANGYSTYAYHGFNRNFWNRNVAFESLGYQKFYAADNYPEGAIINMGLNDGDFLSKTAEYIKTQPKPSLSYVITLSSHVPFATTELNSGLKLNTSDYPDQVGGYLENINYTDRMLGTFFDKLKSEGLYNESLIIVYGDHTPVLPSFSAGTINYDVKSDAQKEVPLFIKLPKETSGQAHTKQGTHLDITPTIYDLLGIKTKQLMFGQSIFAQKNSLQICSDQTTVFNSKENCDTMLSTEKSKSATIIRYNQFDNISKF